MPRNVIDYHLHELEIAKNPLDRRHYLPVFLPSDESVLDIGCGIGQTFLASKVGSGKVLVGLDADYESLAYGHNHFESITYVNGSAHALPFADESFDLVISRVSLPYTNIPYSIAEIYRVCKANGRIWISLHDMSFVFRKLNDAIKNRRISGAVFDIYILINGIALHIIKKAFYFPLSDRNRIESFQTNRSITRILSDTGFERITVDRSHAFIVTAFK